MCSEDSKIASGERNTLNIGQNKFGQGADAELILSEVIGIIL